MSIDIAPLKGTVNGKEYFLELGEIEDAFLGREDHGIFTVSLRFSFNGSVQSAGNFVLADPRKLGEWVQGVLDFFGTEWSMLKYRRAYVIRESAYGPICGLLNVEQTKAIIFSEIGEPVV